MKLIISWFKLKHNVIAVIMLLLCIARPSLSQGWQWAEQVGTSQDYGGVSSILITDGSNSYLMGWFFAALVLETDTFYSYGFNDLYIVKYDESGNRLWAKTFGGYNNDWDYEEIGGVYEAICNCVYITGIYYDNMELDTNIVLTGNSGGNIFLAKLDIDGNFLWAEKVDSFVNSSFNNMLDKQTYIYSEPDGDIFMAGCLRDTSILDTFPLNPGGFFARFDSNGTCKWAENKISGVVMGMQRVDFIGSDFILTGYFDADTARIDTATLILSGLDNAYIARFDSLGNVKWVNKTQGTGSAEFYDISIDSNGNIYAVGLYKDTVAIDSLYFSNPVQDILICKYNGEGQLLWVNRAFCNNDSKATDICEGINGDFYITGNFSGTASFGTHTVSTSKISEMFFARYDQDGQCYGVNHFGEAYGFYMVLDNEEKPVCTGRFVGNISLGNNELNSNGLYFVYLVKSDSISSIHELQNKSEEQLVIYANPTAGTCNIVIPDDFQFDNNLTLSIYDNRARLIRQIPVQISNDEIKFNIEAEAKGIYNIILSNNKKQYSGKLIFE